MGEPDRAIAALQKLLSIPGNSGPVWATYSSAAPGRSDVRSASERSAFPETRRGWSAERSEVEDKEQKSDIRGQRSEITVAVMATVRRLVLILVIEIPQAANAQPRKSSGPSIGRGSLVAP